MCNDNPSFKDSLIAALFNTAVAKYKYGNNATSEEKVANFCKIINTYKLKLTQVVTKVVIFDVKILLQLSEIL